MAKNNDLPYDLDFRPDAYWDTPVDPNVNIKGEWRRKKIKEATAAGEVDEIPPAIFGDSLSPPLREFTGSLHPKLMGGEYLPDYEPSEIEIVRLCLASTTGDVISLTAMREGPNIRYRWRDEYEDDPNWPGPHYIIPNDLSKVPLSLRELIDLLQNTTCPGYQGLGTNLIEMFRDDQTEDGTIAEAVSFMRVESEFYPDLAAWYRHDTEEWLRSRIPPARKWSSDFYPVIASSRRTKKGEEWTFEIKEFADLYALAQFVSDHWPSTFEWKDVLRPGVDTSRLVGSDSLESLIALGTVRPAQPDSFADAQDFSIETVARSSRQLSIHSAECDWDDEGFAYDFASECKGVIDELINYGDEHGLPLPELIVAARRAKLEQARQEREAKREKDALCDAFFNKMNLPSTLGGTDDARAERKQLEQFVRDYYEKFGAFPSGIHEVPEGTQFVSQRPYGRREKHVAARKVHFPDE